MRSEAIGLLAALACVTACQRPDPSPPTALFNTTLGLHDLMEHVIDPAADNVWAASGVVVDLQGEHDLSPKTPEAWGRARDAAAQLAESGNLLLLPGRLRPGRTWARQAQTLSLLGLASMKAADSRDKAAMLRLGGDIHDACEECHRVYVLGEAPKP